MHWVLYFSFTSCAFLAEALIGENLRAAKDYEYPFVVSIATKNSSRVTQINHFCMGILISDKNVLTCAHCLEDEVAEGIEVWIGGGNLHTSKSYNVATWTTFDSWSGSRNESRPNEDNDIAMLLLSRPISDAKIKPVKLAATKFEQIDGLGAIIAGFGITNNGTLSSSLMTGNVTVLSRERCNERMRDVGSEGIEILNTDFCSTADPFILGGTGDSGGPVLNMDNELLGIHMGVCPRNSTFKCPKDKEVLKTHQSNVHLSVDFYRNFIRFFR